MEYEVGSIADLISGNRTPNRQKVTKKPLTPVKLSTPPSKNVTPRENKNIGKLKTPKIALTPEVARSPRTNNVKNGDKIDFESPKSATKKRKSKSFSALLSQQDQVESGNEELKVEGLEILKGKRKSSDAKNKSMSSITDSPKIEGAKKKREETSHVESPSKKHKTEKSQERPKIKNKLSNESFGKKNKKGNVSVDEGMPKRKKEKNICSNQSESEHESDNHVASDNENIVAKEMEAMEASDDEQSEFQKAAAKRIQQKEQREQKFDGQFLDRTLFVGNIPISVLKKNHERVLRSKFAPYGAIESVRVRNIPVPDLTTKPKLAFIEKNFHAERSSVIAYIVFVDPTSVEKALVENNSVLDGNHLRVDKCHESKVPVDPRKSLFCGGLPFNVEEETLRNFFEKCGDIDSVRIVRDRKTQMGKGIAFINFASPDGVELALAMDEEELKINNRQFRIKRYNVSDKGDRRGKGNRRDNNNSKFANKKFEKDGKFGQLKKPFQNKGQNKFGKKRDEMGNKIRKRDADGNKKFVNNKKDDLNAESSGVKEFEKKDTEEQKEVKGSNSREDYKGLMAKKKKKMKQSKAKLEKKKMSKILTQAPKTKSDE